MFFFGRLLVIGVVYFFSPMLVSSAGWNYEDVAVWVEGLQLEGVKDKLQDAGIDSKHLFMLVESDLQVMNPHQCHERIEWTFTPITGTGYH